MDIHKLADTDRAWLLETIQRVLRLTGPLELPVLIDNVTVALRGDAGKPVSDDFKALWLKNISVCDRVCRAALAQLNAREHVSLPGQVARGIRRIGKWTVFGRDALVQGHADLVGALVNMRVGETVLVDVNKYKVGTVRNLVQRVQGTTSLRFSTRVPRGQQVVEIRVIEDTALGVKATG